jgi:serine/threonine protein kinase
MGPELISGRSGYDGKKVRPAPARAAAGTGAGGGAGARPKQRVRISMGLGVRAGMTITHNASQQVDVWASGVLLFVLLLGMFPFEMEDENYVNTAGGCCSGTGSKGKQWRGAA